MPAGLIAPEGMEELKLLGGPVACRDATVKCTRFLVVVVSTVSKEEREEPSPPKPGTGLLDPHRCNVYRRGPAIRTRCDGVSFGLPNLHPIGALNRKHEKKYSPRQDLVPVLNCGRIRDRNLVGVSDGRRPYCARETANDLSQNSGLSREIGRRKLPSRGPNPLTRRYSISFDTKYGTEHRNDEPIRPPGDVLSSLADDRRNWSPLIGGARIEAPYSDMRMVVADRGIREPPSRLPSIRLQR